jgi:hypothetical protein
VLKANAMVASGRSGSGTQSAEKFGEVQFSFVTRWAERAMEGDGGRSPPPSADSRMLVNQRSLATKINLII